MDFFERERVSFGKIGLFGDNCFDWTQMQMQSLLDGTNVALG
jgi:hypothetical protein